MTLKLFLLVTGTEVNTILYTVPVLCVWCYGFSMKLIEVQGKQGRIRGGGGGGLGG